MSALPNIRRGLLYLNSLSLALFAYGGMYGSNVNKKVGSIKDAGKTNLAKGLSPLNYTAHI